VTDLQEFTRRLFAAADQLWTNSALRPDQYGQPVLALIALRQMEAKFEAVHRELALLYKGRLKPKPSDYQARGAIFLPENARFSRLLALPGTANLGAELNSAMKGIADANPDLAGALPQGYAGLPNNVLQELLRLLAPLKIEGDAYGLVFEYFMGQFASSFMQKGGEYFTPASIVKLIVEVIEPYRGTILDPACGSGGMFVHSAEFVRRHHKAPSREISIYGVEKMRDTLRLCRMNLAVHGLSGDLREANSYYDDPHKLIGRFDFVMANPPFNQPEVDRAKLVNEAGKVDPRSPLGLPTVNNANYIWINLFYAALNPTGRAGFVMANSASDAGGSEREIRKRLIESGAVDCVVAVGPNMFFTVTLPVTLWFLDKGKAKGERGDTPRSSKSFVAVAWLVQPSSAGYFLAITLRAFSALSRYRGNGMFAVRLNTSGVMIGTFLAAFCSRTQPDKRTMWSGDVTGSIPSDMLTKKRPQRTHLISANCKPCSRSASLRQIGHLKS
jgi:type I restriction enzyme M protein